MPAPRISIKRQAQWAKINATLNFETRMARSGSNNQAETVMKTYKLLIGLTALAGLAMAQDDPPARAARLNYISGQVSFQPAGAENWEAAPLNRPLISGDRIWAEEGSRAEMHFGSAAVRVGSATSFTLVNLDDQRMQAELVQGSLIVRLREVFDDEIYQIDTPHVSFRMLRAGEYRVDVQPDGFATILSVRSGEGEAAGGGQTFTVRPSDQVRISGTNNLALESRDMPRRDGFDQWSAERDLREDRSQSAQFVGRGVIGYEDLDDHGVWTEEPSYGRVWLPRGVPAGWEPYRHGHWEFIAPWGWTWIDDASWGFAPFHYGRWVMVGGGWGWVPGPRVMRPVYSPAMVAWVGGAPRRGLAVSVGWFPLGPREVYVPAHRASAAYVNRVNVTNTRVSNVQVTNVYNNTTVINNQNYVNRQHVTVISRNDMESGRRVQRAVGTIPPEAAREMQVTRTVDVTPRRVAASEARPAASAPPPSVVNRRAVDRRSLAMPGAVRTPDAVSIPRPVTRAPEALQQEQRVPRRPAEEDRSIEPQRPIETRRPIEVQRPVEPRQSEPQRPIEPRRPAEVQRPVEPRQSEPQRPIETRRPAELQRPVEQRQSEPRPIQRERPAPPARERSEDVARPQRAEPPARIEQRQEPRQERKTEQPVREEKKQEVKPEVKKDK